MRAPGARPLAFLLAAATLACAPPAPRKLVEFGWDEPDPAFMAAHATEMDATPFDGCVFHVSYDKPGGAQASLTWDSFGRLAHDQSAVLRAVAPLRAGGPRRFTENFLRLNVTPGDLDWFDDWSAIAWNARLAARAARAAGARGVLLDVEQYQGRLFDGPRQRDAARRPFGEYAAQARRRGRDVMEAFQSGYPDLTVFLTFGHSLPYVLSNKGQRPLSEVDYGLLAPFLDGLLDQARGQTRIVDGYELSYGFTHEPHFDEARRLVTEDTVAIVGNVPAYRRRVHLAFGLWMDYDWRRTGWDTHDFSKNHFNPESWASAVGRALVVTDEYVWIYGEQIRWWGKDAASLPVPEPYEAPLENVRRVIHDTSEGARHR